MSVSDDPLSRRRFLDKTAKTGLVICTVGPWSAISQPPPEKVGKTAPEDELGQTMPHRTIDQSLCVGCRMCVPLCPMGAIRFAHRKASIDSEECAECATCSRSKICPVDAIKPGKLEWPRVLRETFSNPETVHEVTGVTGRGTEETKTNDSQNRYKPGDLGVLIELGRPVLGTRFVDVERVVKMFRAHGYEVIQQNPVAALINDPKTGALKPEILNEKIISCVIEFVLPRTDVGELTTMLHELSGEVASVFSVSVALRADEHGRSPFRDLFGPDMPSLPNAKVNIGTAQGIGGKEATT